MQTIGKAQVIAQAWEDSLLGRIPKDKKDYPEWYKNRLELCKKCPKNSSNIRFFKLPPKVLFHKLIGRPGCSLCGCFIKEKAWMKTEVCPLKFVEGEKAKWNAMEVITADHNDFNIECPNDSFDIGLTDDESEFYLNIFNQKIGDKIEIVLFITHKDGFHVKDHHLSCGCIGNVSYNKHPDNENRTIFRMTLDASKYTEGHFEKHLSLIGYTKDDPERNSKHFPLRIIGEAYK